MPECEFYLCPYFHTLPECEFSSAACSSIFYQTETVRYPVPVIEFVTHRNSRVWRKDSTLKWNSWKWCALFLLTFHPFSLVSRSSTPSCCFAYRKWRRLDLQSRKRRAIYLHKLKLQRRSVLYEKNLYDNAPLSHAVVKETTIIFLFCRAIMIQNKPGLPKTKNWRLILMLVWKNKQQHKRELVLPCKG